MQILWFEILNLYIIKKYYKKRQEKLKYDIIHQNTTIQIILSIDIINLFV